MGDAASGSGKGAGTGFGPNSVPTQFQPGVSGNPGGRPKGFESASTVLTRFSLLTRTELKAMDPESLTMMQAMCHKQILDSMTVEDDGVRLRYMDSVADRTGGKPTQAAEVKINTTVNPIDRGISERDKAMAAAELMRSAGIDVPAALQALIEAGEDDE